MAIDRFSSQRNKAKYGNGQPQQTQTTPSGTAQPATPSATAQPTQTQQQQQIHQPTTTPPAQTQTQPTSSTTTVTSTQPAQNILSSESINEAKNNSIKSLVYIVVYAVIIAIIAFATKKLVLNIQPLTNNGVLTIWGDFWWITLSVFAIGIVYFIAGTHWKPERAGTGIFLLVLACYCVWGIYYYNSTEYKTSKKVVTKKTTPSTIYEKKLIGTFDDDDMDPKKNIIVAFTFNNNYNVGDKIEVVGTIPAGAREIEIFDCKGCNPEWHKTTNGYFKYSLEKIPYGKKYSLWIEKGKGITFEVYHYKKMYRR